LNTHTLKAEDSFAFPIRYTSVMPPKLKRGLIIAGDNSGRLYIIRVRGLDFGAPIVTPTHYYLFDESRWDNNPIVSCESCGKDFIPDETILNTIHSVNMDLKREESPCLRLRGQAWDDPRLYSKCPHCGISLRYNPFVAGCRSTTYSFTH
jgi:hypothetical protein